MKSPKTRKAHHSATIEGQEWNFVICRASNEIVVRRKPQRKTSRIPLSELVDLSMGQRRLL